MEELADAIEDAQYVNAISTQDNGPRPVLPWEKPTADELLIWEEAIQDNYKNMKNTSNSNSTASQPFSMEWCCQQPIGYFLFSQYVKDVYDDYPRMNFCEQVCRFQKCQLVSVRMELAAQIARDFLGYQQTPVIVVANQPVVSATATAVSAGSHVKVDATADVTDEDPATPEELEVKAEEPATAACKKEQLPGVAAEATHEMVDYLWPVPPRTEIEEYDLARPGPAMPSLKTGNHLPNDGSKSNPTVPSNSGFSLNSCQNLANIKKLPSWLSNKFSIAEKTTQELQSMYTVNMDFPICSESVVGVKGPILKDITKLVEEMETAAPPQAKSLIREEGPASDFSSRDNHVTRRSPRRSGSGSTQRSHATMDKHERVAAALEALGTSTKSIRNSSHSHTSNSLGLLPGSNHSTPKYGPADTSENFNNEEDDDDNEEFRSSPTTKSKFSRPFSRSAVVSGNVSKSVTLPNDLFEKAEYVAMESLRRQYWDGFVQSPYWIKLKNFLWYQDRRVLPEDFFVLRVLGRGGFGLVTACKRGTSGKLYAMKVMNKRRIKMKRSEVLALSERKALAAVESKFVINLKYSFHSKDDVFLILDLMTGGDLGFHLHQRGRFSKKECLYFAARIMLGLGALHEEKYVYRDLKPENCLLAEDGRVKITDLGLATKIIPSLHGAAGTRGYWAPEMLRRDSRGKRLTYDHTVDWFSFGCCVAEFISGSNPFRSDAALNFGRERGMTTKETMIDCATLEMIPDFPTDKFESDAADLCRRLLEKNEKKRLGHNGCDEIMAHPWFKSVNWESIASDRKKPPFIPAKDVNAASQSEIGTFAEDKQYHETVFTAADEEVYKNWDWTNPRAFAAEVIEFWIYERITGEALVPIAQDESCCCSIL